ncbi:PIN domain-containing protein [Spirulina major CS-329]|uniref:type II toxin-antitoxin system VapC family toxin n=1 Tax=Spirulina TaxID=1154 RepID=UPI00232B2230|nr:MULTISPECIES: PIN domain-containing protein [Spirulina]MDB9496825.1 PIN domain-containing protein [Spirulina subsalsa CS-330]MDB9504988.1 PIN domain-containing protein [Spirulina major CS-329]
MSSRFVLVDSGVLVAFYNRRDRYHSPVVEFLGRCTEQLITTVACVTEVMWLLAPEVRVQNHFLSALEQGIIRAEPLIAEDYRRIQALNHTYQDLPADFADLSLVAISERLNIAQIATLDQDFDVYRRYRQESFVRVFYPQK